MTPPSTPDRFPDQTSYRVIVEVKVGPTATSFKLHKNIICFYSGYFEKTFNGGFAEAGAGTVSLTEESVDIFERFASWMYSRRLPNSTDKKFGELAELWIFGDRREIPLLMNVCIDAIRDMVSQDWKVSASTVPYIYENTTTNAKLRRLAINLIGKTYSAVPPEADKWPPKKRCETS